MHCEVALAFAAQGYHMLCEKPMATSIEDCVRIADAVKKAGIIFAMGHGRLEFDGVKIKPNKTISTPLFALQPGLGKSYPIRILR